MVSEFLERIGATWVEILIIYLLGLMSGVLGWNIGVLIIDTFSKYCCKKKIESI